MAPDVEEHDARALDVLNGVLRARRPRRRRQPRAPGRPGARQPERASGARGAIARCSSSASVRSGALRASGRPRTDRAVAGHYLSDLVYGANDGIITTFAVVSGVVGASLSEQCHRHPRPREPRRGRILDGGEQLPRAAFDRARTISSSAGTRLDTGPRRSSASSSRACFRSLAYLLPALRRLPRFPSRWLLAGAALFAVGAARTFVTKRGFLRSGVEMLLVGSAAGRRRLRDRGACRRGDLSAPS